MNIYQSINEIMQEIEAIGKNKTNESQKYKFRGIDDMYNVLHPLFKKHSVFIVSNVLESKREERTTRNGGLMIYSILKCKFIFYAQDGSSVESIIEGEGSDTGDKSTNKAMSTALKYSLMQMFLIPTEEKLDTEYQSPEFTPKQQKVEPPPPPMTQEEMKYRTNTNDVDFIVEAIDSAKDAKLLRMFLIVNEKFFKSNDELKDRLAQKFETLKKQAA